MPKIEFQYQISKTANLFHFISNLANWHHSVRPHYRKLWLEKTGDLTNEDNKKLEQAKKLFQKHDFRSGGYWGKVFFDNEESVWSKAKEVFSKEDCQSFEELSEHFSKRFELVWQEDKPLLEQWSQRLGETEKHIPQEEIINILNSFFPDKLTSDVTIKINLLLNPANQGVSGGANTSRFSVEMEVSHTPENQVKHVWSVIWHELIHKLWQKQIFSERNHNLVKKLKIESPLRGIANEELAKEMITDAFVPHGYIRQVTLHSKGIKEHIENKLHKMKSSQLGMLQIRYLSSLNLASIVKQYVDQNREIDQDFYRSVKRFLTS